MKKVILGLFLVVILGVGAAFLYVMSIDWNEHKDKIAEQFYNITGKEIVFDGRVSFKILPVPYLSAYNAKVYNTNDKEKKPLMEIKHVMAELSLPALMKKEFHVTKMVLDGAVINIDWDGEGINWQGDLSPDQRQMMEESNMVLNSVTLKNAEVNIESSRSDTNLQLTNLNGEVSAQSVFGPFRIEGNYLKGNTTEGFAITVGKLSENFATTLNGVVTHPKSNSYVRFDGTFHLNNKIINGNVIIESQKMSDFVNANTDKINLSSEYNYPVALGFDINLSEQNLSMSNIVIKYGDTQGSGTFQMPLDNLEVPEIEAEFNFSDLDLEPFVKMVQKFYDTYKENPYQPDYKMDLSAKVKAIRANYNGQGFKNLMADISVDDEMIMLSNFSVILPGDTDFRLKGNIYAYDDQVYYQGETTITASDLLRTLQWLKIDPKANVSAVYKKMLATAKIMGNFDKIQISPYKVTLDKSTLSGEAGIVLGDRKDIMVVVKADTINFDNYISALPDEEKQKSWAERMRYRFEKLDVLNDIDLVLDAKADLIIYESMPFEKVDFKGNILNGLLDMEYCKIEQVANTALSMRGKIKGFGGMPQMDMLQYEVKSNDVSSLINKLELDVPNLDYKKFNNLAMTGAINGTLENFGINNSFALGNLNAKYQGQVFKEKGLFNYKGNLEIKHPDFSKLLANLKLKYQPAAQNLGLLQFNSEIDGNFEHLMFNGMSANIGYSNFAGSLEYDDTGERTNIVSNMKINKFEIDKFLPKRTETTVLNNKDGSELAAFLEKPNWRRDKIDYSPYIYADLKGNFDIAEMSYRNYIFKDVKFEADLANGVADIKGFSAVYNNTPIKGNASLTMTDTPTLNIQGGMEDALVNDFSIGGKNYSLKDGKFSLHFDFSSAADSEQSFISKLNGKADFKAYSATVNGLGLMTIYNDLIRREEASGLVDFVKSNIGNGKMAFDKVEGRIIVDNGKYNLADAVMSAPNTEIKLYGEGSLADWEANVVFNVKHEEPKYLPEYSFSLKNGMDNPTVDVNVSSLFKLYQSREDQKEAARVAEVEAEKTYWADLVAEQQKTADDLVNSVRSKLEKEIDDKLAQAFSDEAKNKYNALKQDIARILASLVEVTDAVVVEDGDNSELINKMKEANRQALVEAEDFSKRVQDIYLEDLKKKNEILYNQVVEAHNALKKNIFSYNTQSDKYGERLAAITTTYDLKEDADYQELKKKADDIIAELEKLNGQTETGRRLRLENAEVSSYEIYNQDLEKVYASMSDGDKELVALTQKINDYVQPKIKEAEDAYHQKITEEENKRKIEENTGSISIKKTGKTLTVVRDIEDIKNAEAEVSTEGVKVLDFSKEKYSVEQPKEPSNENVIKKGRNILIN